MSQDRPQRRLSTAVNALARLTSIASRSSIRRSCLINLSRPFIHSGVGRSFLQAIVGRTFSSRIYPRVFQHNRIRRACLNLRRRTFIT